MLKIRVTVTIALRRRVTVTGFVRSAKPFPTKIQAFSHCRRTLFFPSVLFLVMVDAEAEKKRLSFKDALINKYSLDEDEELCFIQTIHISRSPEHKGTAVLLSN